MPNEPVDILKMLDKAAKEYLERRKEFGIATTELKSCESAVDEILSKLRKEIMQGPTRGSFKDFGSD